MEKNKLKKIGMISIGVLTLLSTSLSIVAIVKSNRGHHMPPYPPAHVQEHQDGHGPRGNHGAQGPGNAPEMEREHGPKDPGHEPQGAKDDNKPGDEHGHRPPQKDENKKGDGPKDPGKNPEEKKDQAKEIH